MAVKLRMKRMGRLHRSVFRISAMEGRAPRDGKVLEELGIYDPANRNQDAQLKLNLERVKHWLSVGAVPSETVAQLIKKAGVAAK